MSPPARGCSILACLRRARKGWWAQWAAERCWAARCSNRLPATVGSTQRALDPLCPEQSVKHRPWLGFGVHEA